MLNKLHKHILGFAKLRQLVGMRISFQMEAFDRRNCDRSKK